MESRNKTEKNEGDAERLRDLMTRPEPVVVTGIDFMACNFGDESQNYSEAGRNSIISGNTGSAIYNRETGQWQLANPHAKIVNASHLPKYEAIKMDIEFEEFRKII